MNSDFGNSYTTWKRAGGSLARSFTFSFTMSFWMKKPDFFVEEDDEVEEEETALSSDPSLLESPY